MVLVSTVQRGKGEERRVRLTVGSKPKSGERRARGRGVGLDGGKKEEKRNYVMFCRTASGKTIRGDVLRLLSPAHSISASFSQRFDASNACKEKGIVGRSAKVLMNKVTGALHILKDLAV